MTAQQALDHPDTLIIIFEAPGLPSIGFFALPGRKVIACQRRQRVANLTEYPLPVQGGRENYLALGFIEDEQAAEVRVYESGLIFLGRYGV